MFRCVDRKSTLEIGCVAAETIRMQYKSLGGSRNLRKSNLYPRIPLRTLTRYTARPSYSLSRPIRSLAYMHILHYADRVTEGKALLECSSR